MTFYVCPGTFPFFWEHHNEDYLTKYVKKFVSSQKKKFKLSKTM
jgi:hypothetical protein